MISQYFKYLIFLFAFHFYLVPNIGAKSLFVNNLGKNASDSYSRDQNSELFPWKSLQRGLDSVVPGDTLVVDGGPYQNQVSLSFGSSGTQAAPIVLKGKTGKIIYINGTSSGPVFEIQNRFAQHGSWLVIENLHISGGTSGIRSGYDASAEFVFIKNNVFSGVDEWVGNNPANISIQGNANDIFIEGNEFTDNPSGHGIVIFSSGDVIIKNNYFYNFNKKTHAILSKHLPKGALTIKNNVMTDTKTGIFGNLDNSIIENNLIYNSIGGIKGNEGMGNCSTQGFQNNLISHNTIVNNTSYGILLKRPDDNCGQSGGARNNKVYDNILFNNNILIWQYNQGQFGHNTLSNFNLFFNETKNWLILEYGKTYSLVDWQNHSGQDLSSIGEPPGFVNSSGLLKSIDDFRLKSNSPAVSKASDGSNIGADIDKVGIQSLNAQTVAIPVKLRISK